MTEENKENKEEKKDKRGRYDIQAKKGEPFRGRAAGDRRSAKLKVRMLKALKKTNGVVRPAIKMVGINPSTHYNWLKKDPVYKKKFEEIDDFEFDYVKEKFFELIENGNDKCIIKYFEWKGKKHGYSSVQEIDATITNKTITVKPPVDTDDTDD